MGVMRISPCHQRLLGSRGRTVLKTKPRLYRVTTGIPLITAYLCSDLCVIANESVIVYPLTV